jgi:hypothetical protein
MVSEIGDGVVERFNLIPKVAVFDEHEEKSRGSLWMNTVKVVALGLMLDTITVAMVASNLNIYERHPAVLRH